MPFTAPGNVFVTGANGYIGLAVAQAFVRAGWNVFGLIRRKEAAVHLYNAEVTPIIGDIDDLSSLEELYKQIKTVNVIVGATDVYPGYGEHYARVLRYIRALAETSNANGVRPLVLWTSGCKDYGETAVHGAPDLAPHTEESPVKPTYEFLQERATFSLKIFDNTDVFDAAVLRPTNVFGRSSSHYGKWFIEAAKIQATGNDLKLTVDPQSIIHSMHVDDCGEAYVALAEHPNRKEIGGQSFNLSGRVYETTESIWKALEKEYGIEGKVHFVNVDEVDEPTPISLTAIFAYSQWVGSEKIRKLTGWTDRRFLFGEHIGVYRRAYETALASQGDDINKQRALTSFLDNN